MDAYFWDYFGGLFGVIFWVPAYGLRGLGGLRAEKIFSKYDYFA